MKRNFLKKVMGTAMSAMLAGCMLVGCGGASSSAASQAASDTPAASATEDTASSTATDAASGEKYKIALSNSYMGNDWRQLMIKTTQVVATKEPYASKVDLDVVTCENTAEAQAASIDALVEQDYDAILINAASATALIPSIQRAVDAGITVVTFDNTVEADGVYRVSTDLADLSRAWASYLVTK